MGDKNKEEIKIQIDDKDHKTKKKSSVILTSMLSDPNIQIPNKLPIDTNTKYSNNWNDANKQTLKAWKSSLLKASFIYKYVLKSARSKLNFLLVIILILTTVSSLLSAISTILLSVDNPGYKLAALILSIIIAIISAITAIFTGAIKIYKLDDIVVSCTSYIEKIDQLYSAIANQLVLPDNLKEDAIIFIKKMAADFLSLIQSNPDVDLDKETEGLKAYNKFMEDKAYSFAISQKHDNDFAIEVN